MNNNNSERNERGELEPNPLYKEVSFLNKLGEYYDAYLNSTTVSKRLNEEFGCHITPKQVKKIYVGSIAEQVGTEKDASKFFEDSFVRMQKRYEESWEMIADLVMQYKKFRKLLADKDELTQAITFMKMTSQIISITTEIRKQLEFIGKQQEEIRVYQQNNLIVSPLQINEQIKKFFKRLNKKEIQSFFKSLDDNRYNEIVRELPDKTNLKVIKSNGGKNGK